MLVIAVTLIGKVAYIAFFVIAAGCVAAYGWIMSTRPSHQRPSPLDHWIAWMASFLPPSGKRLVSLLAAALILVLGGFGVAGGFHL